MSTILESGKVRLRLTQHDDIAAVVAIEQDPQNRNFIAPYSTERHAAAIDQLNEMHLIIEDKMSGQISGFIVLAGLENEHKSLEFRRIVVTDKGKGFGRESLQLVKKLCFEHIHFHRLWLDVFEENKRALRLYKSAGFVEEGTLRDCVRLGDSYRSLRVLSLLQSEYLESL